MHVDFEEVVFEEEVVVDQVDFEEVVVADQVDEDFVDSVDVFLVEVARVVVAVL